jgi:aquaporin Z
MNKLLTEFIGTFFLMLTVALASAGTSVLTPLAIGCALMVMVYMGGHISGAHYNPAVTLAVWIRGKIKTEQAIPYIVVQLLGAFVASFVAYTLVGRAFYIHHAEAASTASILVAESLFTFALALVVLNVATVKQVAGNSYYGAAIGLTVTVGAVCVGNLSGGAFNPAVGVGSLLFAAIKGASITHAWMYIVGPCMGAMVAALVFKLQNGTTAD